VITKAVSAWQEGEMSVSTKGATRDMEKKNRKGRAWKERNVQEMFGEGCGRL
jgi:hypothetical protein